MLTSSRPPMGKGSIAENMNYESSHRGVVLSAPPALVFTGCPRPPPAQPRRRRCKASTRCERTVDYARLHKLLQALPRDRRLHALKHQFTEQQRLLLEEWMLQRQAVIKAQKNSGRSHHDVNEANQLPRKRRRTHLSAKCRGTRPGGTGTCRPSESSFEEGGCPMAEWTEVNVAQATACMHEAGGIQTNLQPQGCFYSAQVCIDTIRLKSKAEKDVSVAQSHLLVLAAIKHRVSLGLEETFEARFRHGVRGALLDRKASGQSLGLRFAIEVHVTWFRMSLKTRSYRLDPGGARDELDEGLAAWRCLQDARMEPPKRGKLMWVMSPEDVIKASNKLCSAYLAVMAGSGCRDFPRVVSHVKKLQEEQALRQEQMMETWNRSCMGKEDRDATVNSCSLPYPSTEQNGQSAIELPGQGSDHKETATERRLAHLLRTWTRRLLLAQRKSRQKLLLPCVSRAES
mmetsp:Transcript_1593/g.3474  ORF Transcript_1593/g.3474 Transcript_1593/m.3474 type:complete len:458 (+) Transcript_1593:240-1613(+)